MLNAMEDSKELKDSYVIIFNGFILVYAYTTVYRNNHIFFHSSLITLYKNYDNKYQFSSVQLLSRVRLFALCNTPGLPVHRQLLEFTQTHVHPVNDALQPSRPLLSPSPPAFNLSQHQGLFK